MQDLQPRISPLAWMVLTTLAFLGVAAWLYLPEVLCSGPRGIHFIRQTDSLSFMMNYGRPSWNFFKPSVYDLRYAPDNGMAAAEFPFIYYVLAVLQNWLGVPYTILRSVNLLIVLCGHWLLTRLAAKWLASTVSGLFFSLWIFSSSVLIYYACNYLPDAAAYGAILSGMCLVIIGQESDNWKAERLGAWCLVFAGLAKTPAALYLLAYAGSVIFSRTLKSRNRLWIAFVGLTLIAAWNLYAIHYNAIHRTHYFMTWAEPIWSMSHEEIVHTWEAITTYWWTKYLHPSSWHVLALLSLVTLVTIRRISSPMRHLLPWLLIGTTAFILLFFRKMTDHDYYFLIVAPFLALIALSGLRGVWVLWQRKHTLLFIALSMAVLCIMGLQLGHTNLERRFMENHDPLIVSRLLEGSIKEVLNEYHVPDDARFIVWGDPTPNGSLLFLDKKGWTYQATEPLPPLDSLIQLGANHLVTIGTAGHAFHGFHPLKETRDWSLFRVNNYRDHSHRAFTPH